MGRSSIYSKVGPVSLAVRDRSRAYEARQKGVTTGKSVGFLQRSPVLLEWGSVTKTVTAQIASRLALAGDIDLAAPVAAYLPDSQLPEWVDVSSLITHTSGLPSLPPGTPLIAPDPYAHFTTAFFDERVVPQLGAMHDGTVGISNYSNLGYAVLTRALEKVTGRDWASLASALVLNPLGLDQATTHHDPQRIVRLRTWGGSIRSTWVDTGPFVGAGGLLSTFEDLCRYARGMATAPWVERRPIGWMRSRGLWWHNGHNRDQGSFVGFDDHGSTTVVVHTLGYRVGTADRIATKLNRPPGT